MSNYDYKKHLDKDKKFAIRGIKILGDEFNKYDEPENNFKLNDMIAASEIDPDDDKVVDKTAPKYYYTKILGDKLNNLKEEDIDVVEVDENKPMNEI